VNHPPVLHVVAWWSGVIDFVEVPPLAAYRVIRLEGADAIVHGCRIIAAAAELGRDGLTLRIPRMAEAERTADRIHALDLFCKRIRNALGDTLRLVKRKAA